MIVLFGMNLLIANLISAVAAIFTAKSSWAKDTWHIYIYQVAQCLLLAIASIFFNSYAGIVTLLVCALRNYHAAVGKLTRERTLLCLLLILVFGILFNNRGYTGYVVIAANAIYTVGMFCAKRELAIKCNIALDLTMWIVYEALIIDIPSLIADAIALALALVSVYRIIRGKYGKTEDEMLPESEKILQMEE